ncbi:MAG: dihydropyrimidinase [Firmicutes bacterium]|uniref:Dihydropyrimidinase n=1 Tax=Candidatus Scybalomonas excrementavium TaxID=2840943 RepID=A0A9D9I187_9FIRM|nr:dihydropyrimidinase [Candidatus Scybalomonas excrementavium]
MKLIKNGTIITDGKRFQADIAIENGKITQIGQGIEGADEVIDATDCYIFAGFIDPHTHFELDTGATVSPDDFYYGTKAAVLGGTTTIIDFATAFRGETLKEGLDNWHHMADGKSSCNYGFHMAFTEWNPSLKSEIKDMANAGVTSFKVYMAYDALRTNNEEIFEILEETGKVHGLVGCHCEDDAMIKKGVEEQKKLGHTTPAAHPLSKPSEAEGKAVKDYLELAKRAGVPVCVVHLSTKAGLEEIRKARAEGQKVFVETCPQYLIFTDEVYSLPNYEGAKYVISPPLRKKEDVEALWEAISNGEIDTIATDQCSFNFEGQKTLGKDDFTKIPGGMPGVENRIELMYTYGVERGKISLEQLSKLCTENVAKQYGMYPKKGAILEGSDADIVIWDPNAHDTIHKENQHYHTDYTPYEGIEITGKAKHVLLNGEHVVKDGELIKEKQGKYVARGNCF